MKKRAAYPGVSTPSPTDLRAGVALAVEATIAVAGITEAVHQSIWATLGRPNKRVPDKTRGLTGFVYRSVTGVTRFTGAALDHALAGWERVAATADVRGGVHAPASTRKRAVALAALNGVIGDRLAERHSPLAMPMSLRGDGADIDWSALPATASGKIVLFIHGLCMEDGCWRSGDDGAMGVSDGRGVEYAAELGDEDTAVLYLRYNTGRHICANGAALSALLVQLVQQWPAPIADITIIAHSMGGLVARSACATASQQSATWLPLLKRLIFLGTPHAGAPLEKLGEQVDALLGVTPYSAPFRRLTMLRSAGITDLRHGRIVEAAADGGQNTDGVGLSGAFVPLPLGVACYAIAGTLSSDAQRTNRWRDQLLGDGLVPVSSALGEGIDGTHKLNFASGHTAVLPNTGHMALLHSPAVLKQLQAWLPDGSA